MNVYVVEVGCFNADKPRANDSLSCIYIISKYDDAKEIFERERRSIILRGYNISFECDDYVEYSDYPEYGAVAIHEYGVR